MNAVDRAATRVGGDRRKQRGVGDTEAHFLAFHVAARLRRGSVLIDSCSSGLPRASAQYAVVTPHKNKTAIAAHTAQPWRGDPVIRPSV